jgi:hypothetical protein
VARFDDAAVCDAGWICEWVGGWDGAARGVIRRPSSIFKRAIWGLLYRYSRADLQELFLPKLDLCLIAKLFISTSCLP